MSTLTHNAAMDLAHAVIGKITITTAYSVAIVNQLGMPLLLLNVGQEYLSFSSYMVAAQHLATRAAVTQDVTSIANVSQGLVPQPGGLPLYDPEGILIGGIGVAFSGELPFNVEPLLNQVILQFAGGGYNTHPSNR